MSSALAVRAFLESMQLGEYVQTFMSEGFDRMDTLLEIHEEDFAAMGVKRGHRRIIQGEIARMKAMLPRLTSQRPPSSSYVNDPPASAIAGPSTPPSTTPDSLWRSKTASVTSSTLPSKKPSIKRSLSDPFSSTTTSHPNPRKRRYRRHPKPDVMAPVKPLSAYVRFSNAVRDTLPADKSFVEISKLVGQHWQALDNKEKERLLSDAANAKVEYLAQMQSYRFTPESAHYQEYLAEFREQHDFSLPAVATNGNGSGTASPPPPLSCSENGGDGSSSTKGDDRVQRRSSTSPDHIVRPELSHRTQSGPDNLEAEQSERPYDPGLLLLPYNSQISSSSSYSKSPQVSVGLSSSGFTPFDRHGRIPSSSSGSSLTNPHVTNSLVSHHPIGVGYSFLRGGWGEGGRREQGIEGGGEGVRESSRDSGGKDHLSVISKSPSKVSTVVGNGTGDTFNGTPTTTTTTTTTNTIMTTSVKKRESISPKILRTTSHVRGLVEEGD